MHKIGDIVTCYGPDPGDKFIDGDVGVVVETSTQAAGAVYVKFFRNLEPVDWEHHVHLEGMHPETHFILEGQIRD